MYQLTEKILIPKPLIDPYSILDQLNKSALSGEYKYFRIFNTRSGKDVYLLHRAKTAFLFRDPKFISCLNTEQTIELLYKLNSKLKDSRYLDFEIIPEDLPQDVI